MNTNIDFVTVNCAECNIPFAITTYLSSKLHECHNYFYCPVGHQQYFPQKSDVEKLRDRLREKDSELKVLRQEIAKIEAKKKPKRKAALK